jgi:hypothetical protein
LTYDLLPTLKRPKLRCDEQRSTSVDWIPAPTSAIDTRVTNEMISIFDCLVGQALTGILNDLKIYTDFFNLDDSRLSSYCHTLRWLLKRCNRCDRASFSRVWSLYDGVVRQKHLNDFNFVSTVQVMAVFPVECLAPFFQGICAVGFEKFGTLVAQLFGPLFKIAQKLPDAIVIESFNIHGFLDILQTAPDADYPFNILKIVAPVNEPLRRHCLALCLSLADRPEFSPHLTGIVELVRWDLQMAEIVRVCEAVMNWVLAEPNLAELKTLIDFLTVNLLQERVIGRVNVPCDELLMMICRLEDSVAGSLVRFIEVLARNRDFPPRTLPRIRAKLGPDRRLRISERGADQFFHSN